jgi:transcriptional regulator with XRE-family HTH domain
MTQLRSTREIREEALQRDPEFRAYWARTALARAVANEVIRYRVEHDLTQSQLARTLGMSQPAVARLEIGEHNPTWDTLNLLAGKLGATFMITISPSGSGKTAGLVEACRSILPGAIVEEVESPATRSTSFIITAEM